MSVPPAGLKPVKRRGQYWDGITIVDCVRWEHYIFPDNRKEVGVRVYTEFEEYPHPVTNPIKGYSIAIHDQNVSVLSPRPFNDIPPMGSEEAIDRLGCPDGYIQVCVPNSNPPDCWCEWEGLSDPP